MPIFSAWRACAAELRRYPYLVFYVEHEDHIDIWRVLHERRDIPASLADSAD